MSKTLIERLRSGVDVTAEDEAASELQALDLAVMAVKAERVESA